MNAAAPLTSASMTPAHELMAFKVGEQEYCVEVRTVREIRGWTATTPLPNAPPHVRGVVNLRGLVLPVIDLGARLGLPPVEPTARHVIIVAWIGEQLVGLLVDSVCDIVSAPEGAIQPPPDVACEQIGALVGGILTLDGRMLSLLRLENVLPPRADKAA